MNRRQFIRCAGAAAAGLAGMPAWARGAEDAAPAEKRSGRRGSSEEAEIFVRPAMFWEKLTGGKIQCRLCPRQCVVSEGRRGHCGVRENRGGEYFTLVYGRSIMPQNDPIEKKPFNHFRPGTMVLSAATAGCNFHCKFCQNWQLSQSRPEEVSAVYLPPEKLVALAMEIGSPNVALTYSEPTVFYEYLYHTARRCHEAGLKCVVVSNGYISTEAVKQLAPYLAAYRIDLKSFSDDYYRKVCAGRLSPVLETLKTVREAGLWLEIINLVLPTLNDDKKDVRALIQWVRDNLGDFVPIHFTRFRPMFKMLNLPPTPVSTLEKCYETAKTEGIKYPYVGNLHGHPYENTYCHNCGELLIGRVGLWSVDIKIKEGRCHNCGVAIPGVWT